VARLTCTVLPGPSCDKATARPVISKGKKKRPIVVLFIRNNDSRILKSLEGKRDTGPALSRDRRPCAGGVASPSTREKGGERTATATTVIVVREWAV